LPYCSFFELISVPETRTSAGRNRPGRLSLGYIENERRKKTSNLEDDSAFAGLAFLLASIGIFGVVSYSVARRSQEIGIRVALGANRSSIFRMIVHQAMRMAGTGLLVGVVSAIALMRVLPSFSHLLYGVGQWDVLGRFRRASACGIIGLLCTSETSDANRSNELLAKRVNAGE